MAFKIKDGIAIGTTNIFDNSATLLVNAPTATKFATARSINGTSFDGTADITVTADASTLTGTTLKSTVVNSSLTSVGTIATGTWQGSTIAAAYLPTGTSAAKGILQVDGTTIVATAGVISYTLPTASTSTLGGVKVDGTSISVSSGIIQANAGSLIGTSLSSNIVSSSLTSVGTLTSLSVGGAASLTGALTVGTNATIQGNLTVQGNINYTGTVTQNNITTTNGVFNGDTYGFGAIYAGVTGGVVLDNTIVTMIGNKNDLTQVNLQNKNIGAQSTAEYVATSSNGGQTYGFIDMGIANSAWDGTQANSLAYAVGANDGYLYVQGSDGVTSLNGGNLIIGTGTSGQVIKFNVGGLATTSGNGTQYIAAVINAKNTTSSSTTTGTLVVTGGVGISGATNVAGALSTSGTLYAYGGTISTNQTTFNLVNTTATTVNIAGAGTTVSIGASSGTTTVNNNMVVTGTLTVNGTTNTINSTTVTVDDKNIELGSVATPTDTTADGGGITLKGASDKTIIWDQANTNWTSSEHWNLSTGKSFKINNTAVLSATALGSAVVSSSLTSVGTIATGVWNGTAVTVPYGGTGAASFTSGALLKGAGTSAITTASASDIVSVIGSTAVSNATNATNATNVATTGAVTTSATHYIGFVTSNTSGNLGINTATNLTYNPGTGALVAGTLSGNVSTANLNMTSGGTVISNRAVVQAAIATTSATSVDAWPIATYRSAKYIVQVKQGTNYSVHEILVIHDGTTTYKTEYGVLETNSALATFTTDISSTNARLLVTMGSSSSATINISRELIVV